MDLAARSGWTFTVAPCSPPGSGIDAGWGSAAVATGGRIGCRAAMPSRLFRDDVLAGQVTLVTGGGSGLGRATAVELAACGAQVVVAGRRREPLEETAALCEGGRCE